MNKAMSLEALTLVLAQHVATSEEIDDAQLRSAYSYRLSQQHPELSPVEISATVASLRREEIADRMMREVTNKMAELGFQKS